MVIKEDASKDKELTNGEAATSKSATLPPTQCIYMTKEGHDELNCEATVLEYTSSVDKDNQEIFQLVLDVTTMYPQGGGQPSDMGTIETANQQKFFVHRVDIDRASGVVTHRGTLPSETTTTTETPPFSVGSVVSVQVEMERRRILSECHSAGHVVDAAMARCGYLLRASKGYHFLDGPYVEYHGTFPASTDRDALVSRLQTAFTELLQEDIATTIQILSTQEAQDLCDRVAGPGYWKVDDFADPQEGTVRIVTVAGWPCPCGGTHVRSTGELMERKWNITGMKTKKGLVRIKYGYNSSA